MKYKFDFDEIIDRRNSNSCKWDSMDIKYKNKELIHLGVADMDFKSSPLILETLNSIVNHGVFGYTDLSESYYDAIVNWSKRKNNCDIKKDWIVFCPRINVAASLIVNTLTNIEDSIIINTPAYAPLKNAIIKNNRKIIESPLVLENDRYRIDFKTLEKLVDHTTKLFILCSPHNPTGRVWTTDELEELSEFCNKNNIILLCDEIHEAIISKGSKYISALNIENLKDRVIVCSAPTKTFNIPGIITSYMIIPNEFIRKKIMHKIDVLGMHNPNIFSVKTLETAYNKCDDWLEEVNKYIDENEEVFIKYINKYMNKFKVLKREGTYLLWIDCRNIAISEENLEKWFIEEAKVSVYMGTVFGEVGKGFIRINLATQRNVLLEALERMKNKYNLLL